MVVLRSDIERALDDLISNEDAMRFQGLAVVLAKQKWPEFVASERKKDLGADAVASASISAEPSGKVLACSVSATLAKIRSDATKIKKHVKGVSIVVFATPKPVTKQTEAKWAGEIRKEFDFELIVMSREDIITSLMMPSNASLCRTQLGIPAAVEACIAELIERVREGTSEETDGWSTRIAGKPLVELTCPRLLVHLPC